jgi:hypothetical protein
MKFDKEFLQQKTLEAIDRNILVYDSEAEPCKFTERLVSLMRTIMCRETISGKDIDELKYLFTTSDCDISIKPTKFSDINFCFGDDFDLTKFYIEQKAPLAINDKNFVLAIGKNGKALGGSF